MPEETPGPTTLEPPNQTCEAVPIGRACIYIVDDEPGPRSLAAAALRSVGFTNIAVFPHVDKEDGILAAVRQRKPDLMLVDIRMPRVSGGQFLQMLKEEGLLEGIIVFLVTATPGAGENSPYPVIDKPYAIEELCACVREALEAKSQAQEP